MSNIRGIVIDDSDSEFDVDELEEVYEDSEDEWLPNNASKSSSQQTHSTKIASSKKKRLHISEDEDEEESPTRDQGRATNAIAMREPEEEPKNNEQFDNEDDIVAVEEEVEEEDKEKLDQGPGATPSKPFTTGAFVVLKTEMVGNRNPPIWKIDCKELLQKYIPFTQDNKVLYKNTIIYSNWSNSIKNQYYSAPISFIKKTSKEHIIEFYKDKIKIDPKVEEAATKELEEEEYSLSSNDEEQD